MMGSPKFTRQLLAALHDLGCINVMILNERVHYKIKVQLPTGQTRILTCSRSPADTDTAIMQTRRLVRRMIEGNQ
jgi:hypothetical protein